MKGFFIKKYVILTVLLLISSSLYSCNPMQTIDTIRIEENIHNNDPQSRILTPIDESETSSSSELIPSPTIEPVIGNKTPTPIPTPETTEYTVHVRGKSISLGDSKDILLSKYGVPNRVVETEYDFEYYVYNNDYTKLLMVALSNSTVVGFYTDSTDFSYRGISYGSDLNTVNRSLGKNFGMEEVLKFQTNTYRLDILIDSQESQSVIGVYVLNSQVKKMDFTATVMRNIELLVYDLTNSVRARNGLPTLSWSTSASIASRKHSIDMANNNYFDHVSKTGTKPGDRMRAEGIYHTSSGENIIGGYGTAILSNHAWFNSPGHRKTMLSPNFRYLGVGFFYKENSLYKTYITQNFYR